MHTAKLLHRLLGGPRQLENQHHALPCRPTVRHFGGSLVGMQGNACTSGFCDDRHSLLPALEGQLLSEVHVLPALALLRSLLELRRAAARSLHEAAPAARKLSHLLRSTQLLQQLVQRVVWQGQVLELLKQLAAQLLGPCFPFYGQRFHIGHLNDASGDTVIIRGTHWNPIEQRCRDTLLLRVGHYLVCSRECPAARIHIPGNHGLLRLVLVGWTRYEF
mmetsp:Transcript_1750/g.3315  ORF Transcript_1750/g.3315 Transcript_1750/m.3315 type:complete len:219 (+) Transcript_1750:1896-2552(+)